MINDAQPITINTAPSLDPGITLDTGLSSPILSPELADRRATLAHYGLIGLLPDKSKEDWFTDMVSGREDSARKDAAGAVNQYSSGRRTMQMIDKPGLYVPPGEAANPQSVFEKQFAQRYFVPTIDRDNKWTAQTSMIDSMNELPDVVKQGIHAGINWAYRSKFMETQLENLEATLGQHKVANTVQNFLLGAIPGAYSAAMRLPALHTGGIGAAAYGLLGSNLESQSSDLWHTPNDSDFEQKIKDAVTNLGPNLGYQWLTQMYSMSGQDKLFNSMFDAIDLSGLAGPALQSARDTISGIKNVARSTRAVSPEVPVEATNAAARGDLHESAVKTAADQIDQAVKDKNNPQSMLPQKQAVNSLTNNLQIHKAQYQAGPIKDDIFGQDLINRLDTQNDSFVGRLTNRIENVWRVSRLPYQLLKEDVVREDIAKIKGQFRGAGNAVTQVDGPFYREVSPGGAGKLTNTYWYEVKLGTYDGGLHATRKQAELFAELNGLTTEKEKFGHEPISGMNKAPIEYDNYTEFRKAARAAGVKQKDLKTAKVDNSIAFEKAKASQTPTGGYEIKQQGQGWYVSIPVTRDEFAPHALANISAQTETKLPELWASNWAGWFNWLRQAPDTLSAAETAGRRIATHAPNFLKEIAGPEIDILKRIPPEFRSRFNDLIAHGQELYDKQGRKGYFFESPQEIDDWYQLFFQKRPSTLEIEGYFAWKRLAAMDLSMRNVLVYRNQAIHGAVQHRMWQMNAKGEKNYTPWVSAIPADKFPNGNESVLVLGKNMGDEKIVDAAKWHASKEAKELAEAWQKGEVRIGEIYEPRYDELSGWGKVTSKHRIRYVIGKNIETKPLDVGNMVPERGGGHVGYNDYDSWIGQPNMRHDGVTDTWWYERDNNIMPMVNMGPAKDVAKKFDTIRQYMQAGMIDEARYLMRTTLPVPEEKHLGWYFETKSEDGKRIPPFIDVNTPIVARPTNKRIGSIPEHAKMLESLYGDKFRDGTRSGGKAAQFQVEFTGERDAEDLHTVKVKGSKSNPLYEYQPASKVSPIPVMARALNRITQSFFNDDYKMLAMNNWLSNAVDRGILNKTPNEVWHSPWWNFNNPIYRDGLDENTRQVFESNRAKIQTFAGARNKLESWLHTVDSKFAEQLYNKYGPRAAALPLHLIPFTRDPWRAIRSLTVHRSLGLFNVPSMFVQGSTTSNIIAFAGHEHISGTGAAIFDRWTRFNQHPEFIAKLDDLMVKHAGWRPGEYTEAQKWMRESGFQPVDRDHVYHADPDRAISIRGKTGTFLHWGMWPFREGAEFVRTAAFYTAYHEFRHGGGGSAPGRARFSMGTQRWEGKVGAATREEMEQVLDRAGWLDHNMSRAATSSMQQGVLSIPTLFISYRLRLTEALFGRVLNPAEKARLLGFSMFLYGIPAGPFGLVGLPLGDYMRQWAVNQGYAPGNNAWADIMMEGMVGTALAFATGAASQNTSLVSAFKDMAFATSESVGDWFKRVKSRLGQVYEQGNHYNIGERYGNEGLSSALVRNESLLQVLGGAPGGMAADASWRFGPLARDIMHITQHPPRWSSIDNALNVLNGYSNFSRMVGALNAHEWLSKNGTKLTPTQMSTMNSIFQGITGLSDSRTAWTYVQTRMLEEAKNNREIGKREAMIQFHNYLKAIRENSNGADRYREDAEAAFIAGGNNMNDWSKFVSQAYDTFGRDIVTGTAERAVKESPDPIVRDQRQQQLEQLLQTEHRRGER